MKKFLLMLLLLLPFSAQAQNIDFDQWRQNFKAQAMQQGIQPDIANALDNAEFLPRVIELDQKQPEGQITYAQYLKNTVTNQRIAMARQLQESYAEELAAIEQQYGVPSSVILALWGKESSFGKNQGSFSLLSSLATLAYEGRRAEFFQKQLIAALRIMQDQHFTVEQMTGSWAGAFGQCQFMPTTYLNHAADGDGDGQADIWRSVPDVLASIANYLRAEGWQPNESWGRAVTLPTGFNRNLIGKDIRKPVDEWAALGIAQADGQPLPQSLIQGYLVSDNPTDGKLEGNMYLVYNNFDALLRWNKSRYFGLAVGTFANRILSGAENMKKVLIFLCAVLSLAACSSDHSGSGGGDGRQPRQQTGYYKVGRPYEVSGETYTPKEDYAYDETGIASWYGPGFHGGKTANGETYDTQDLTAAHRTLPLAIIGARHQYSKR